jgi:hypothetical protein
MEKLAGGSGVSVKAFGRRNRIRRLQCGNVDRTSEAMSGE